MSGTDDIDAWPDVLRQIAEDPRLGRETALRLARAFGGTEIFVSRRPRPDSLVVREIGRAKAEALFDLFGGGRLMIPIGPLTSAAARRQVIRRLLDAGRSHAFIARSVKCHVMTVKREQRRHPDIRQSDLFDR